MSVAIRAITRVQDADDINVTLGVGVDEYALCWDNDTARFVLRAPFAGLLATGATTGATSQAQTFTNGIVGPSWKPSADSTTALQLQNATGTSVLNVDTTNARVGIGTTAPQEQLHAYSTGLTYGIFESYADATSTWLGFFASKVYGPAIYWKNTQDMRFVASDTIRADVITTERMRITSTGLVGVGTSSPGSLLHGLLTSAATNAVTNVLTIGHDTSGTAAAGFGAGQLFNLESSTTAAQAAARIQALWYEATHATRKADLVLTAYDTAEREGLRVRGNGSAAAIGFLGATPAARIAHVADPSGGGTVDAEARTAINSILATLETFGFHATS